MYSHTYVQRDERTGVATISNPPVADGTVRPQQVRISTEKAINAGHVSELLLHLLLNPLLPLPLEKLLGEGGAPGDA